MDQVVRKYWTGLSVGEAPDFTAVAALEKVLIPDPGQPGREVGHYAVRLLERFPPGTAYPAVAARVAALFAAVPLTGTALGVDLTGVGHPVLEVLRRARPRARLRPVLITNGHKAAPDGSGGWQVPKRELISNLQVLFQARRLVVAPALTEAETLVRELVEYRVKAALVSEETLAWREGPQDDLVFAVAVAAWLGERPLRRLEVW
jgi:hypothetical protein